MTKTVLERREYARLMHYDAELTHEEALQRVGSLHNHKKVPSDAAGKIRECECGARIII
jgi:hypothetical protein